MKRISRLFSICILLLITNVTFGQALKVNRDMNLLNNDILNVDVIYSKGMVLNSKNLDSLLQSLQVSGEIVGDSLNSRFGARLDMNDLQEVQDYEPALQNGNFVMFNGTKWGVYNVNDYAGSSAWTVDNVSLELTLGNILQIKNAFISQYEKITDNNVKLALKAPLDAPTFTNLVQFSNNIRPTGNKLADIGDQNYQLHSIWSEYLSYYGTSSFSTRVSFTTPTVNRNIYFPNADGTLPLGTGSSNLLAYWSGTNTLSSLSTSTYPSLTELSYVKGVTSSIQSQLSSKLGSAEYTTLSNLANSKLIENFEAAYHLETGLSNGIIPVSVSNTVGTTALLDLPMPNTTRTFVNDTKVYSFVKMDPDSGTSFTLIRTKTSIVIDSIFVLVSGSGTDVTYNITYGTNRTTGTNLKTGNFVTSYSATGTSYSTLGGSYSPNIPVNNMIWLNINDITNYPEEFLCVIYYH